MSFRYGLGLPLSENLGMPKFLNPGPVSWPGSSSTESSSLDSFGLAAEILYL